MKSTLSPVQQKMLDRLRGGDLLRWCDATHLTPERVSWVGELSGREGYRRPSLATWWALLQRDLLVVVEDRGDVKRYAAKKLTDRPGEI